MPLRVVLIGAGSHVFGLSMLSQFLVENDFPEIDLVLVDPDEAAGKRMQGVGNKLRAKSTSWTSDLDVALPLADYVICAAAVQMQSRFERDREIIHRLVPGHLLSEFGGVYGAASTMRQLSLVEEICLTMRKHCAHAKLFMISNPMPRLVHGANLWGIDVVGFCSVSTVAYNLVARLLGESDEAYPFAGLRAKYKLVSAGTNHLAWLTSASVRSTGENILPRLHQAWKVAEPVTKSFAVARQVGALPVSGDDHIQDFLPPIGLEHPLDHISHGSAEDRGKLNGVLDSFAAGKTKWADVSFSPSWERPGDVIRALRGGEPILVPSLNLPNRGQIPNLGSGAIVETPVLVNKDGFLPIPTSLPTAAAAWNRRAISVTASLMDAYRAKSLSSLKGALFLDPTVTDHVAAAVALEEIIGLDLDLIGKFV